MGTVPVYDSLFAVKQNCAQVPLWSVVSRAPYLAFILTLDTDRPLPPLYCSNSRTFFLRFEPYLETGLSWLNNPELAP